MHSEEYKKPTEFSFSKLTPSESGFQPTDEGSSKIIRDISVEVTPWTKNKQYLKGEVAALHMAKYLKMFRWSIGLK